MERFSMNEFQPLTLLDKQNYIRNKLSEIKDKKRPIVIRKQEIEAELSKYVYQIRTEKLEHDAYKDICRWQNVLKQEKMDIERKLSDFKQEESKLNMDEHNICVQIKKIPNGKAKQSMLDIRDKYMSFAADTTRVSSMRAMASRFVEEIQTILSNMS